METSIAGMLILGVLLIAVMLMARAMVVSNTLMSSALAESADLAGERARTMITFVTSTSDGTNVTVDVSNSGNTSIADYEDMDVIVTYQRPGTLEIIFERLTYVTGTPGNDEWTNSSLAPDTIQPGIWDPGETLTIEAKLNPTQMSGTTGKMTVSTPNGVGVAGNFSNP